MKLNLFTSVEPDQHSQCLGGGGGGWGWQGYWYSPVPLALELAPPVLGRRIAPAIVAHVGSETLLRYTR